MLISIYLPFSDYRPLMIEGFLRLARPTWPSPETHSDHVRNIGSIRYRRKEGFEGWVGEDRLAVGVRGLALQLPRKDDAVGSLRLIRKACYFDGLLNGRIELLFRLVPKQADRKTVLLAARHLLNMTVKVKKSKFDGPMRNLANAVGMLWADATVKHGEESNLKWVRAGRPICIVESETYLGAGLRHAELKNNLAVELSSLSGDKPTEMITISRGNDSGTLGGYGSGSDFRRNARFVRTYVLRLLQNVEALSMLFSLPLKCEDDRAQNLLNEYTRQINRSRQHIQQFEATPIVEYCYAAFSRLYPGKTDGLRVQIQNSTIRPNLARKVLQLLDISEASNITVLGDFNLEDKVEGDKIMGDKYQDVTATGQGIAIGRGAKAEVSHSSHDIQTIQGSLASLADTVRKQSDRADAEVEATIVDAAAKKAADGDEKGAAAILKKSAGWVLDLAKSAGSAVLVAFLKSHFGIG
jgi:hypothetical protein